MKKTLVAVLTAGILVAPTLGSAGEVTTFNHSSAGCSGGGNACGTFPLVPTGAAEYDHSSAADGSLSLSASAERGAPAEVCLPGRACEPLTKYHAEATGRAWTSMSSLDGATQVIVASDYAIEALAVSQEPLIGPVTASVAGVLAVVPDLAGQTCSDGSAIQVGNDSVSIDETTPEGADTLHTIIRCTTDATLPALTVDVSLRLDVVAEAAGGFASVEVDAALTKVSLINAVAL